VRALSSFVAVASLFGAVALVPVIGGDLFVLFLFGLFLFGLFLLVLVGIGADSKTAPYASTILQSTQRSGAMAHEHGPLMRKQRARETL
jgi:hypothetical protein